MSDWQISFPLSKANSLRAFNQKKILVISFLFWFLIFCLKLMLPSLSRTMTQILIPYFTIKFSTFSFKGFLRKYGTLWGYLPLKFFIVLSLCFPSWNGNVINLRRFCGKAKRDRSRCPIIASAQLHLWLKIALSTVRVGGKCVVHMKVTKTTATMKSPPLLFSDGTPGRFHWWNRCSWCLCHCCPMRTGHEGRSPAKANDHKFVPLTSFQ